jgi:hypothetical protein
MGRTFSTHGTEDECIFILVEKLEEIYHWEDTEEGERRERKM